MRRWVVRPCLEALELRTLPSSAVIELPTLPVRATEVRAAAFGTEQTPVDTGSYRTPVNSDGPGLDRLLQDLGQLVAPVHTTPLETREAGPAASTPAPGLIHAASNVGSANPNLDGNEALDPGLGSTPSARPSAPLGHAAATSLGDLSPGFSQSATALPDAAATGVPPAVETSPPPAIAQSADYIVGPWIPPGAAASHNASSMPTTAALATDSTALLQPDAAVDVSQVPNAPAGSVWDFPDAGRAVAAVSPPLDASAAVALPSDVNGRAAELPDGVLLKQFVAADDQAAFTTLVARHERLVLSICRRVLGDAQTAEDALQATFLVLARKASGLDPHRPLAGWLYLVAYHIALRLRAVVARRRRCEFHAACDRQATDENEATGDLENHEIHQVLREELQRLPEKYRVPLVLCYFDGQTHAEAARTIGMPRGSMAKRIGEGLERLRQRLIDRGIAS
jgi:RNA polymerase sigma factor (sigma-70 family)